MRRQRPWGKKMNRHGHRQDPHDKAIYRRSPWISYCKKFKRLYKYCARCLEMGLEVMIEAVDHVIPWRFGGSFWDPRNHEGLCASHHGSKSGTEKAQPMYAFVYNNKGERIPKRDRRGLLIAWDRGG